MRAPVQVATESAMRAPLMWGRRPFSSSMLLLEATPMRVPSVSKRSTKRKAKITAKKSREKTEEKSILPQTGRGFKGMKAAKPAERLGKTLKVPNFGSGM